MTRPSGSSRIKKAALAGGVLASMACAAVAKHEGLRLVSYADVVGVWTVCYGETRGIRKGMSFTKAECDRQLLTRLDEFGQGIEKCAPRLADEGVTPPARYIAHLSLAYNIGTGAYCKSTVARRFNAGDTKGSCNAFLMWNKAGGVAWKGLTRRREEERELCLRGL